MEPIVFKPLYMPRVWGGRALEDLYGRALPDDQPYGESWEISDREGEQSIVTTGPFAGKSLHDLWLHQREELFGPGLDSDRFPLLIKILDARDDLSIQVHPPAEIAERLEGEPKTEMWYIAHANPGAKLYLGLRKGVQSEHFEEAISQGTVEECVHAIEPKTGESIFIPSGRLHAIGAGLVIHEIQQNSDTTFRVYDWNRLGLDGKPRDLHVDESLQCIDFSDFEPEMDRPQGNILARCEHFEVARLELPEGAALANPDPDRFSIITVVEGALHSRDGAPFGPGDFLLLPRGAHQLNVAAPATVLQTTIPGS
jgi:mannose-6-phosphate isomerase